MTANIITASLVKELRERTGSGMMECKKALEASGGDIEVAIDAMRKSGQAKAAKKAGRVAAEGAILLKISADGKQAFIAEINCETDFVARDNGFIEFANQVVANGLAAKVTNLDALMALTLANGKTVVQAREDLIAKIGENINVRRVALVQSQGIIGSYIHGNNRIGVLVQLSVAKPELGRDIAMHIAASKPMAVNPEELPADLLASEKAVYLAQVQDSGKPAAILEKMVTGRLQKFIADITLVKQPFVKNPDITIEKLLQQEQAQVTGFVRFEVGDGIEKPVADFAEEVQKMIKS